MALSGHCIPGNKDGLCTLPDCWGTPTSHRGDMQSFLLSCPSLSTTRVELTISNLRFLHDHPNLEDLVRQCLVMDEVQFWMDCNTMSPVISAVQVEGEQVPVNLLKMTKNYCHRLHVTRNRFLIDQWIFCPETLLKCVQLLVISICDNLYVSNSWVIVHQCTFVSNKRKRGKKVCRQAHRPGHYYSVSVSMYNIQYLKWICAISKINA